MNEKEKEIKKQELEDQMQKALRLADLEYYKSNSPHYRDNKRYSWAVKAITDRFDTEIEEINKL